MVHAQSGGIQGGVLGPKLQLISLSERLQQLFRAGGRKSGSAAGKA